MGWVHQVAGESVAYAVAPARTSFACGRANVASCCIENSRCWRNISRGFCSLADIVYWNVQFYCIIST